MFPEKRNACHFIAVFVLLLVSGPTFAQEAKAPVGETIKLSVSVFGGLPGDAERDQNYRRIIGQLSAIITGEFAVGADNLRILYSDGAQETYPACTLESLRSGLEEIARNDAGADVHLLVFLGHASADGSGGAKFNISGPDMTVQEMATLLGPVPAKTRQLVIVTTELSNRFLEPLRAAGRGIICADHDAKVENEPELGELLPAVLRRASGAATASKAVTALDLFLTAKELVAESYAKQGYLQDEHPALDGDGDGRATRRPARRDHDAAAQIRLR